MTGPQTVISRANFDALLFDLDGVVTRTAAVHAAAWKRLFDEYLEARANRTGESFRPFDSESDYRRYVDGKPRYDGVQSFLASRGITLPYGTPGDDPQQETICGLGNKKNAYFRDHVQQQGVEVFPSSVTLIQKAKEQGFKVAVVSSSRNCAAVLEAAGLQDFFDARVDGVEIARLRLNGKPAPDMFLEAARRLGVEPGRAVVFEDAVSGVQAGRNGGFGLVVGVARAGQAEALRQNGAAVVVSDLQEIDLAAAGPERSPPHLASALDHVEEITRRMEGGRLAVFLDYDGTLTPIVDRPERAVMAEEMRATVGRLAELCTVAVVSGRDRADVTRFVGLDSVVYAGSHGFDIAGPGGLQLQHQDAAQFEPALRQAEEELRRRLSGIDGAIVEGKRYAVAVHYRLVGESDVLQVREAVDAVASHHPELRQTGGKKIYELRPALDWDKGRAVLWLLRALDLDGPDVLSVFIGDDLTDEDAFMALHDRGIGILVAAEPRPTRARYVLRDPGQVRIFLERLIDALERSAG